MISGYDLIRDYNSTVLSVAPKVTDTSILDNPFTEEKTFSDKLTLLKPKNIAYINTADFSKTAEFFKKNKVYTKAHPIYDKKEYTEFWDEEERKRKEGLTLPGELYLENGIYKLRQVHITGEHYGYLNYAQIKRVEFNNPHGDLVSNAGELITKSTRSATKEIEFPSFWDGDYLFFKAKQIARELGKHLVVAKARRKGFSYKNAWIAANRADLYRNTVTLLAAYNSDSLYPEGTMSMANRYLQFIAKHTDWSKRRLIDRENFIKFGYKRNDNLGIEEGYLSRILAVAMSPSNAGVARGKDADLVLVEESGKNPILAEFLASTLPTLKAGAFITGLMVVFGTGGGESKLWEAFEKLFFVPDTQDFLAFENIYDEGAEKTQCGFFFPSYINKEGFIDEHGNSNIAGAKDFEEGRRAKFDDANDPDGKAAYIAEEPFTPREAFSRAGSTLFDAANFNHQLKRIETSPDIKGLMRVGALVRSNKGVIFKDKNFASPEDIKAGVFRDPILDFPVPANVDKRGSLVLWDLPHRVNGQVPKYLYRIWHDPYAISKDVKTLGHRDSLGVFLIYERSNNLTASRGDKVIGKYIGRFDDTNDFNEELFKAAEFFNAEIQFERNRGDVYNFAREHKKIEMLADDPSILKQTAYATYNNNPKKGIYLTPALKARGVIYVKDWFNKERGLDEFGNKIINLHTYYDRGGVKEALKWNFDGNFDTMSTLIIGMFDIKEEFFKEIETTRKDIGETGIDIFDREWF